ncbi:MSEP-CTERM sorting domain-containing protein [Salmonirosea aquatica]|uniref:MSEP-CTERM sorting domain-containing protein n=1 Tax=Salmonirosea aquatica TaxID=2654236 RepID=A0A7C9BK66_9BACT|nr:MSEP-CTERM sorting domain-containing protein [Cytophagaceae bacterium SJW1-29]
MRSLLNPRWIFLLNTLPIVLLFLLLLGDFNIIKSQLSAENIDHWRAFGLVLALLTALGAGYAFWLLDRKEQVSMYYGLFALLSHLAFLAVYIDRSEKVLPVTLPRWLLSGDVFLYIGTFLMPTLTYSFFVLTTRSAPRVERRSAAKSLAYAIGIPLMWYLFYQVVAPLWKPTSTYENTIITVLIALSTFAFLFFLVRAVYIMVSKRSGIWHQYQLICKIVIAILFPLWGLVVNNGHFFSFVGGRGDSGVFGNFNSYWFYGLAVLNGILICLPSLENKAYRLALFLGRSLTFAYTLYFFVVFLPFLPLSVLVIIVIGLGFLMLTPLVLFVIHVDALARDFAFLKRYFSGKILTLGSVLAFLIIPAVITADYWHHKQVLYEALDYLYTPDYAKNYALDARSLERTLHHVKSHKYPSRIFLSSEKQPYLSAWFNAVVLNNLTLSDAKISTIERVFLGAPPRPVLPESIQNDSIGITQISTRSTFDSTQNAWRSWVDFRLTNRATNPWLAEYATTFTLPAGCWISDYYLYVGARKEMGILAEKKAALWVFSQIRNENRDPGLLYYLTGNKVAFRVFPFAAREVRRTGIEFIHKEPVTLNIGGQAIALGRGTPAASQTSDHKADDPVGYVSAREKQALERVQRKPYYHFLVDVSEREEQYQKELMKRIDTLLARNLIDRQNAHISFVNAYVTTMPMGDDWKQKFSAQTFEGGFYLDRAVKTALVEAYTNQRNTYPVLVVCTDYLLNAVLEKDLPDFAFLAPEGDLFYELQADGSLLPHPFSTNSAEGTLDLQLERTVLKYPVSADSVVYLRDSDEPEIFLKSKRIRGPEAEIKAKSWRSALLMQGQWLSQVLHPETSQREWPGLVKNSFLAHIMTPVTSYLVVENEAQKAILKKKQAQALANNKSLDLGEEAQRMTEPGLYVLALLLAIFIWYRERRKKAYIP